MKGWLSVLVAIFLPGGFLIALLLEARRRREQEHDPDLVRQLQSWAASEPVIAPLALPPVRPLKALRLDRRVARFTQRLSTERMRHADRRPSQS